LIKSLVNPLFMRVCEAFCFLVYSAKTRNVSIL